MLPELIADYGCHCGEGPVWHVDEQCLYWIDIDTGRLFRYIPATGHHEMCYQSPDRIGGLTIQEDGALLLFRDHGAVSIWRDGCLTPALDEIPDERTTRFNDVIADPMGRVFCGTMPTADRLGRLYRLDPDGTLTRVLDNIGCSNGLGFTPDRKGVYYVDSPAHLIYFFDYAVETGALTNQRLFKALPKGQGSPDGLTVDADGFIWCALWNGSSLVRYAPDGTEERRYTFPAKKVSSVMFGGNDLTEIYITTAGGQNKPDEGDGAGALFRIKAGIRGVPEFQSRIQVP